MKKRIIILGDDERSCLTSIRCFGKTNFEIFLLYSSDISIAKYSKYLKGAIRIVQPQKDVSGFAKEIIKLLNFLDVQIIFPTTDNYLIPFYFQNDLIGIRNKFIFLGPNQKGFEFSYDKGKTFHLAEELGLPIPKTKYIKTGQSIEQIDNWFESEGKNVIKTSSSKVIFENRILSFNVNISESKDFFYQDVYSKSRITDVLIQDFFVGVGVGVEILMNRGEIVYAFQHLRVFEPRSGGGSSYRKSTKVNKDLLKSSEVLLNAMNYDGIAMVEFRVNPISGKFVLIEVNGRPWGSISLPVYCGFNFPLDFYKIKAGEKVLNNQKSREGVYARILFRDLKFFGQRIFHSKGFITKFSLLFHYIYTFRRVIQGKEKIDEFDINDTKPFFMSFYFFINDFLFLLKSKVSKSATLIGLRINSGRRNRVLKLAISNGENVTFVCKGNYCRSPFAEFSARNFFLKNKINSVGYNPKYLKVNPIGEKVAEEQFNVNISCHVPKHIFTLGDMELSNNIFLVFDYENFVFLRNQQKINKRNVFFISELTGNIIMVPDPDGKNESEFVNCYKLISSFLNSYNE